jgi:hypothetical protein
VSALPAPLAALGRRLWDAGQAGLTALRRRRPPEWPLPDRPPSRALRAGVIVTEPTRLALSYEWHQVVLSLPVMAADLAGLDVVGVEAAAVADRPEPDRAALAAAAAAAGIPLLTWPGVPSSQARTGTAVPLSSGGRPPLVQPALHNPIRWTAGRHDHAVEPAGDVALTGSWPRSWSYRRRLTAYRAYKVVVTPDAQESAEATACGALALSAAAPALGPQAADLRPALPALLADRDRRDRVALAARRDLWRASTYSHALQPLLYGLGLADRPTVARPTVTALVATKRPANLAAVLATVAAQAGVDVQLALLAHGFEPDAAALRRQAADLGLADVVVLAEPAATPLGTCLNRLVAVADGGLVAKLDDDDYYGPNYLGDLADALGYSGADLVGKAARYVWLEAAGVTLLARPWLEHVFTPSVPGATFLLPRAVAAEVGFPPLPTREDAEFLARLRAAGGRIFSADRFNFCVRRGGSGHTSPLPDGLAGAPAVWTDDPRPRVTA